MIGSRVSRALGGAIAAAAVLALGACGESAGTRDSIRIVGSSTVFPFARAVSEQFARDNPGTPAPIIEATGSGGGIQLFCNGLGADTPDIVNASRRMKPGEFETCQANGVTDITEIQVGLDGIAFASAKGGIGLDLTPEIVYRALAERPYGKEQTTRLWSDVDPSLPDDPILVYGPPSTSGTRDALADLVLMPGCDVDAEMRALKETDEERHDQLCTEVRGDGAYVSQGEQDNLTVQKIAANPRAVGVFGYSFLEENADKVDGLTMNGVEPTYDNIADFKYPGARPLYLYVKKDHIGAIRGLREYLAAWTTSWDRDGPLARIGLVASPDEVRRKNAAAIAELPTLTAQDLS